MNDSVAWTVASTPVAIALYVWIAASLSAVFRKAGQEPWKAWVPILNAVVLLQLGGMSGWFLLLALVPVLGTLALLGVFIVVYVRLNRSFGVAPGMAVLAVLLFPGMDEASSAGVRLGGSVIVAHRMAASPVGATPIPSTLASPGARAARRLRTRPGTAPLRAIVASA